MGSKDRIQVYNTDIVSWVPIFFQESGSETVTADSLWVPRIGFRYKILIL